MAAALTAATDLAPAFISPARIRSTRESQVFRFRAVGITEFISRSMTPMWNPARYGRWAAMALLLARFLTRWRRTAGLTRCRPTRELTPVSGPVPAAGA